jgi:predicted CopG family antitoxin
MNPNKPIRVSKEVQDALKEIKEKKELKSVDAVIKRLLRNKDEIITGTRKETMIRNNPYLRKIRTHCELCGNKLSHPETDYRKTAVCNKCIRGQIRY